MNKKESTSGSKTLTDTHLNILLIQVWNPSKRKNLGRNRKEERGQVKRELSCDLDGLPHANLRILLHCNEEKEQ